jgi:hypothetical protein
LEAHRKSLLLGQVEALSNHTRVHTFLDIPIRLLQQLSNEKHHRRRSVSDLLILRNGRSGNHSGGRVLLVSDFTRSSSALYVPGSASPTTAPFRPEIKLDIAPGHLQHTLVILI